MAAHAPHHPIGIFHEHPHWFAPLFAELDRRGLPYERIDAASHAFDPAERGVPYSLVVNRASPSAYLRGHAHSLFYTLHWLRHLELLGVPVVNGADVYGLELSKARQLDLLEELGLPYPRARVINNPAQAPAVAATLRAPLLIKANVGGSGAGIVRYETTAALTEAVKQGRVELGVDGTALVQECAPLRDGHITRVETLGGSYLYAINVYPASGSFDLCPAEAGPQLRLQYPDQKVGEYLVIGMKPLPTADGSDACFVVGNGGAGLIIIGRSAGPDATAESQSRFVFALHR